MQFHSLAQPMLGLDMVFYLPVGWWLIYEFCCSKCLFGASRQGTGRHYIIWFSYPPTAEPVLLQECLRTHMFLAEYWYVSTYQRKGKQNVHSSTWRHIVHWLTLSSSFCKTCRQKSLCCGQKSTYILDLTENWTQQHVTRWGTTWTW